MHFGYKIFTFYIWPEIYLNNEKYVFGDDSYRNKLCELIGTEVLNLSFRDKKYIEMIFKENNNVLNLNLDPTNEKIVSEIAMFNDTSDNTWSIFD